MNTINIKQNNIPDISIDPATVDNRKAYFVGGGIAALAGAAFLIRDGHIPGANIHILEELKVTGGSLDGAGSKEKGYVIRGGRMIKDEIFEFIQKYVSLSWCRLVKAGEKVDVSSFGLSEKGRLDILSLIAHSEDSLVHQIENKQDLNLA